MRRLAISLFNALVCSCFVLSGPTRAAAVVEFYNTNLDNYFITADSGEAAAIDNGSAGPGWVRTGYSFTTDGSGSVCRFYGSQSPGPNSHFYTADAGECAGLKQLQASTPATQKRWNYEGIAFTSTPAINGYCPSGALQVYRAYNGGSTRGVDSNHRIITSPTAIQQVVSRGWTNEGVVMCALSASNASNTYDANSFSSTVVNQIMPVQVIEPIATPGGYTMPTDGHYSRYANFRQARGDLRGTGMDDVVLQPSFSPQYLPYLPLEIWVNNGDGTFTNKADQLIVGGAPRLSAATAIYIADINGDGRPDILHISTAELGPCGSSAPEICSGGKITYLENQPNGMWLDRSDKLPPIIVSDSNMSIGSSNGDGVKDILLSAYGLHFHKNDGSGRFTDQTYRLPLEIRGFTDMPSQYNATNGMAQSIACCGSAAFAKVVGVSKPILVTASYGYDWGTQPAGATPGAGGTQSVRFFQQQADGTYGRKQTVIVPQAVSDSCGAFEMHTADFTKTGNDDVLVRWELPGKVPFGVCYPRLYRNAAPAGQVNYVDVTDTAIPQAKAAFLSQTSLFGEIPLTKLEIGDVDGTGNLGITLGGFGYGPVSLMQRLPFLYNDGNGNFSIKLIEIDNKPTTLAAVSALMTPNSSAVMNVIPLRLKPNQPLGMLFVDPFSRVEDVTPPPYSTDKQIRLHSLFPNRSN